jgi:hypothetical protein
MAGPSPTNAVWEGFGVDNAISTVNFTYCKSGIKYDSGIPRDANPHRIVFIYNTAPNNSFKVYVDGTMLFSRDPAYIQNLIVLGTEATSGALPFGYFDYVQVTKGPYLTINNSDGLNNSLYDSVNSLVGTGSVINLKTYDFPQRVLHDGQRQRQPAVFRRHGRHVRWGRLDAFQARPGAQGFHV